MSGLSNAFWLWFPVLIFKAVSAFFKTIWKFNLWALQTVSDAPLYYCRPEYRIPAIFIGTFGIISSFNFICLLFMMILGNRNNGSQINLNISDLFAMGAIGLGLLLGCRMLIRRGSI